MTNLNEQNSSVLTKNNGFNIRIFMNNNIFQLYISDYISFDEYNAKMKSVDILGIEKLISNFLLWNSKYQKVNKGNYYIATKDSKTYNVLISEEFIIIDEIYIEDKCENEKIIKVDVQTGEYTYSKIRHNELGSTFVEKQFSSSNNFLEDVVDSEVSRTILDTENVMNLGLLNISKDDVKVKRLCDEKQ